ncbi:MAG TPA: hypothetical protein VFR67_27335 [Pilimelia sp.]|nr:hypothetical protein [Pilimelia sp.]
MGTHLPRCLALIGTAALAALALTAAGPPLPSAGAAAGSGLPPPSAATPDRAVSVAATGEEPSVAEARGESGFRLSVQGAGPYRIGRPLATLTEAGLIDGVAPYGCRDIVGAGATGRWAGKILLVFRRGVLISIGTASGSVRSPASVGPGTSFEQAERVYGKRGRPVRSAAGVTGYVVGVGPMVELFTGHPIRLGIGWYEVGPRGFSLRAFRTGSPC